MDPPKAIFCKTVLFTNKTCLICGKGSDDYNLGTLHDLQVFSVHYLCLVTGLNVYPTGHNEGLLGFLLIDVYKAYKTFLNMTCIYCNKYGASLKCSICNEKYHLPCGLRNGVRIQMLGNYPSCCVACSKQVFPSNFQELKDYICAICLGPAEEGEILYWPTCCKPDRMLHFNCLKIYALTAGYLTKCPLCLNKQKFRMSIRKFGIYVPNTDAIWVKENEFENVVSYPLKCCAEVCRMDNDKETSTVLSPCVICEEKIAHEICTLSGIFMCMTCTQMLWPKDPAEGLLPDEVKNLYLTFPWFCYLTAVEEYGNVLEGVVNRILEKSKECLEGKFSDLLDAEDNNLIVATVLEYHRNYLKEMEMKTDSKEMIKFF